MVRFEVVVSDGVCHYGGVDDSKVMLVKVVVRCCWIKWVFGALVEVIVGVCHVEVVALFSYFLNCMFELWGTLLLKCFTSWWWNCLFIRVHTL